MISTYGELKAEIAKYMHRTDLTDQMPIFVHSAISKINRKCRATEMEKRATITVTSQPLALPTDFLELRLLYKDDNEPMTFLTVDQMRFDDELSKENAYTIYGNQLEVSPDIEDSTQLEAIYYASIPFFTNDTETHDLLVINPMLFLYGAVFDASLYVHDDERIGFFESKFNNEVVMINNQAEMARHSGTPLQIRAY